MGGPDGLCAIQSAAVKGALETVKTLVLSGLCYTAFSDWWSKLDSNVDAQLRPTLQQWATATMQQHAERVAVSSCAFSGAKNPSVPCVCRRVKYFSEEEKKL